MKTRRVILAIAIAAIVAAVVFAVLPNSQSARVTGRVVSVKALDSSEVRVYIRWTNTGKAAGSAACVLSTNVYNAFGDEVTTETNSTNTNGNLKPGGVQLLYQDIGVNAGDASRVRPKDVSITGC